MNSSHYSKRKSRSSDLYTWVASYLIPCSLLIRRGITDLPGQRGAEPVSIGTAAAASRAELPGAQSGSSGTECGHSPSPCGRQGRGQRSAAAGAPRTDRDPRGADFLLPSSIPGRGCGAPQAPLRELPLAPTAPSRGRQRWGSAENPKTPPRRGRDAAGLRHRTALPARSPSPFSLLPARAGCGMRGDAPGASLRSQSRGRLCRVTAGPPAHSPAGRGRSAPLRPGSAV